MNREAIRYTPSIVLAGAILLGLVFLVLLLIELRIILSIFFLGIIVGVALSPVADYFTRFHIPRPVSVLVVYSVIVGLLALFLWYAIPQLAGEMRELFERSGEFEERYQELAADTPLPPLEQVQSTLEGFARGMGPTVAEQAIGAFTIGLYIFSIFVIGLFFTITKDRARELTLSLIAEGHRKRCGQVLDTIGYKLRRYLLAQFISMVFIGVLTYIGLSILGVPFALVLATLAFLLGVLPVIGATIAFTAAFLVALTEGLTVALLVGVFYIAIESIESYVLVPMVQRQQTHMPELLVLVSILFGGALMGLVGAIVALPAALIIYIIAMEVLVPWRRRQVGWAEPIEHADRDVRQIPQAQHEPSEARSR